MIIYKWFRKLNIGGEIVLAYNYMKLRGRIREICGTQDKFAALLGIGRVSLSQRLNNQLEFSQIEMLKACEILKINREDIPSYFFNVVV